MAPRPSLALAVALLGCGQKKEAPSQPPPPSAQAPVAAGGGAQGRADRDQKAEPVAPETAELVLVVDGASRGPIGLPQLMAVKPMAVEGDSGEEAKNAWSARDVVAKLVGPKARLVTVKGLNRQVVAVDEAHWRDPARVPVMRINRRGLVKFFWTSPSGEPLDGGDLRGVTELDVVTR